MMSIVHDFDYSEMIGHSSGEEEETFQNYVSHKSQSLPAINLTQSFIEILPEQAILTPILKLHDEFVTHRRHASLAIHTSQDSLEMPRELTEVTHIMPFEQCPYHIHQYLAIGMFPFMMLGLALTSISIYVYTRPSQRKTIDYLLAWLSLSEWLFLIIALNCFSITRIPLFTCSSDPEKFSAFKAYSDVYVYPFVHITKYMCVCISILISIQQWCSVFVPFKVKEWCSMRRTKIMITISIFVSVFLAIPKFFEKTINPYNGRPKTNMEWKDSKLFELIKYFNDHMFNAFVIFFILFVINISIVCLLKWTQHERVRMTTQNVKDHHTTMMLFAVLLSYVITHFPSMLIEYFDKFLTEKLLPFQIADIRFDLSNFFMCCHPIFSFADYMIFSTNYRKTVKRLFIRDKPTGERRPCFANV